MFPTQFLSHLTVGNRSHVRGPSRPTLGARLYRGAWLTICAGGVLGLVLAMAPLPAGAGVAQIQLLPVDTMNNNDQYGYAVAISEDGNTAVVGAPKKELNGYGNVGAVYVFVRNGSQWQQQAKLDPVQMNYPNERFGYAVGISGDHVIVGTYNSKAAYVFARTGTTWTRQGMRFDVVTPWQSSYMYGGAVAISGDDAVVGDPEWETATSSARGAVHFFHRVGDEWLTTANDVLVGSHTYERYGYSVAARGTRAVAGAPYELSGTMYPGGAWFYPGGVQLSQDPKVDSACFGNSVALSSGGATAVVGAPYESQQSGAVYVFAVGASGFWEQQARLTVPTGINYLGYSCSMGTDIIAAGAHEENGIRGAVYLFTGSGTNWTQKEAINASASRDSDYFGYSVGISGGTVIIGAPAIDQARSGKAYIYEATPPPTVYTLTLTVNLDQCHFRFPSVVGRHYQVERSTTLAAGSWTPATEVLAGTGTPLEAAIAAPLDTAVFFRLAVLP